MKFGELVTVFSVLFLVTFSMGDGAPQWRPQGRFGKRLDQRFPSPWQQSKYTHNINFTLHLFKTYCSQKKIGIGFWSVYHLFTITVKIPFFNMFDHKLPIWEFNTSHTILKKKTVDCLLYSVVRFLKQKHLQYVYIFFFLLVSGTDKDIDVYPVLEEQTDVQPNNVDNIINVLKKVCVESNVPGLFKCYR